MYLVARLWKYSFFLFFKMQVRFKIRKWKTLMFNWKTTIILPKILSISLPSQDYFYFRENPPPNLSSSVFCNCSKIKFTLSLNFATFQVSFLCIFCEFLLVMSPPWRHLWHVFWKRKLFFKKLITINFKSPLNSIMRGIFLI